MTVKMREKYEIRNRGEGLKHCFLLRNEIQTSKIIEEGNFFY